MATSVSFTGIPSVVDRTLFTKKGPVTKSPLPLLTGSGAQILGVDVVNVPGANFTESNVGHRLAIVGSPGHRNDGTFPVKRVLSPTRLQLSDASFDVVDTVATTARIVALANELKKVYNLHRTQEGVHGTHDTWNPEVAQSAVDLPSAVILLNDLRARFEAHMALSGPSDPPVHKIPDQDNRIFVPAAHDMASAILLANAVRRAYEAHRQDLQFHLASDSANRTSVQAVRPVLGSGPSVGPFQWTLYDPRIGQIADETSDVSVKVNGLPASVDAVFGLLGAVVLTTKPSPSDSVSVSYSYMANPPVQLRRLNSAEFGLNQFGNGNLAGLPGHKYRSRSYLLDPDRVRSEVSSPFQPRRVRWKYKAFERGYTAALNDPNTLLLNVPSNRVAYPVLNETVKEVTVRYDPTSLPQDATDPWTLEGIGTLTLQPGGSELVIVDTSTASGPNSRPPFFSHPINLQFESVTSAAFRARVDEDTLVYDRSYTGVGFGLTDGAKAALFGFIVSRATNLSSAISIANDLKAKWAAHLVLTGTHRPDDPDETVDVVDASDLPSLIILANRMKELFNDHLAKGAGTVHVAADTVNPVTLPDAVFEQDALDLVNALFDRYNAHLTQSGVHYVDDTVNPVPMARQVGILTNRGFPEFDTSWNSYAVDWSEYVTYRIVRDPDGRVSLYLSGSVTPIASAEHAELPAASDLDLKLDEMQQVLFGSLGAQTASTSHWAFIRANIAPIDANQIGDNKSVSYVPSVVPELDPAAPWITLGQSGFDRVQGGKLVSDSTGGATDAQEEGLGLTTGAFKGYLRLEPILSSTTTSIVEFTANLGYWTHSLDNRAAGVFVDDGLFSTHFLFLQATPTPASVTGTSPEPFNIAAGDTLILALGSSLPQTVLFSAPVTTVAAAAAVINAAVGFTFASAVTSAGSTFVQLTDSVLGSSSRFQLVGGEALTKLGLSPGTYFGRDSNPEPKVAWFGADFPDLDFPVWSRSGDQASEMLNRTLRITDASFTDFRAYSLVDTLYTAPVLSAANDWKCDFRMKVLSSMQGGQVVTGSSLFFCGALVSLDEGPAGKNVEVQIAQDNSGTPFLNVLSYNPTTGALDSMGEFPFNWKDGQTHTYNIYTSKASGLVIVLADNTVLGMFPYSSLNGGFTVPSVNFGSGGNPVANSDLRGAMSVVDWESIVVFRDGKVSDSAAPSRRYVGVYGGGDPSLLSSYYVHQIDWASPHTYRLVRDPVHGVTVYVDGGDVPVISVNYDPLKLPPASSSFLKPITDGRSCVAFGAFNASEMSRTVLGLLKYSLGKITVTDRLVPPHQVLNQGNVVTSGEHLRTPSPHTHQGFTVYSGGTPLDDFLADPALVASTELGEGMPPVPLTQNLETRGGLERVVTPVASVPTTGFVNTKGFLSDFEDDLENKVDSVPAVLESAAVALFVDRVNDLRNKFNAHLVLANVHRTSDVVNQIETPAAVDLAQAVSLVNEVRARYSAHRSQAGVHVHNDLVNLVSAPVATGLESGVVLVESLVAAFGQPGSFRHISSASFHSSPDAADVITLPDAVSPAQAYAVMAEIKAKYNAHRSQAGVHDPDDASNEITAGVPANLSQANSFINQAVTAFNAHLTSNVHKVIDPANVFGTPLPPYTSFSAMVAATNRLKAAYNRHIVQSGVHYVNDAYNAVSQLQIDPLEVCISALNEIRDDFNAHIVDFVYHDPDMVHDIVVPYASGLATAITLANSAKVKLNGHFGDVPVHLLADDLNLVEVPDATNLRTLITLVQALKKAYESHRIQAGVHGHDENDVIGSPDATDLSSAIFLLNVIKVVYADHAAKLGVHKVADTLHVITSPDAVDLFTGVQLASDLKGNLNAHFVSTTYHVVPDSTNAITAVANDVASLVVLTNQIKNSLRNHFVQVQDGVVSLHVHGSNDLVHTVSSPTPVGALVSVLEEFKSKYNVHRSASGPSGKLHATDDVWNPVAVSATYRLSPPETFELTSVVDFATDCARKFNLHLIQAGVHTPDDVLNGVTVGDHDPDDAEYAIGLANALKAAHNEHIRGLSYHLVRDTSDFVTAPAARSPSGEVRALLLELRDSFNRHVVRTRSHITADEADLMVLADPGTDAETIAFANRLKELYNQHLARPETHVRQDVDNVVTAPDAVDEESLGALVNAILAAFNPHLTQPGVHGSSVFIRLDPPSRVLYNSLRSFVDSSGVEGYVAPAADDSEWSVGPIRQDRPHSLSYEGGSLPEQVTFSSGHREPFRILDGDFITVRLDGGPVDTYELSSSDTTVAQIVEKVNVESCRLALNELRDAYNAHLVQPGVHVEDDHVNTEPLPPAEDLATCIALANHLKFYFQQHQFQPGVHNFDDAFNPVTAGYALDLDGLIDLVAALLRAFAGHRVYPSLHMEDDLVNVVTRTGAGFAKDNGDGTIRLTSPTPGPSSSLVVGGPASVKLGLDIPQFTPWIIRSTNPANVVVVPHSGVPDFLNYGTAGATMGTATTYRSNTGLTDAVSNDIEMTVSVRIHNAYLGEDGDSSIYVGMNGVAGPGFSVAIGFEVDPLSGGCYVKLQDLKAGKPVFKRLFNWNDGQFHTYKVVREAATDTMNLIIVE